MDPESTAITIIPTASDDGARITVNGMPVISGSSSTPIEVGEDDVQVDIIVTAPDGTTKTYILIVIRRDDAFLSGLAVGYGGTIAELQDFKPTVTDYVYSIVMLPELNTITVIPTAIDDNAQITVNGVLVTSGSPSASIEVIGDYVDVIIIVTAEDGTTKRYVLRIIRS